MTGHYGEETKRLSVDDLVYAEALWDHVSLDSEELVFKAGDLITVVDRTDSDWWWGRLPNGRGGWFPTAFVRILVNQYEHLTSSQHLAEEVSEEALNTTLTEDDITNASLMSLDGRRLIEDSTVIEDEVGPLTNLTASSSSNNITDLMSSSGVFRQQISVTGSVRIGTSSPRKGSVASVLHENVRANVINEIITTERDFVKHLQDVVEGYLQQARRRPDMFSDERIRAIFGNMEALFAFQTGFLKQLEACINWDSLYESCVGDAFVKNSAGFEIYSEYCNNHPFAVSELQVTTFLISSSFS